MCYVKLLV